MIRLSTLRSRPRPSWTWWLLMCCGLCPCYRSSVLYGSVDAANAASSSYDPTAIQLEQMTDDEDEDFFEVGLDSPDDPPHAHPPHRPPPLAAPVDPNASTADVVRRLCEAIQRREEVPGKVSATSVNLPLVPLGSRGLSMLSQALFTHSTLTTLELISNEIGGSATFNELSQLLTLTRSLQTLTISHNELSDNSVRQLSVGLRENQSLRSLNLSNNALTDGGLQSLCAALVDNRGLERLDISGNLSIGDLTVDALLDAERKRRRRRKREDKERERQHANTSSSPLPAPTASPSSQRNLTHLVVACNSLSPHCVPSFLELLSLSSLVYLDVSHCLLDDAAAELLVEEAVERSKQLQGLHVEGNDIGERTRKRVDAWRRWVKGLDDAEEKKREESRDIRVDDTKADKKPPTPSAAKANGARSRPRSERSSGKMDAPTQPQRRGEGNHSEREREEKQSKVEAADEGGGLEDDDVEIVLVGREEGSRRTADGSNVSRLVEAAPPDAFTIDDKEPANEEDNAADDAGNA